MGNYYRNVNRLTSWYHRKLPNKHYGRRKDNDMKKVSPQMVLDFFAGTGNLRIESSAAVENLLSGTVDGLLAKGYSPALLEDGKLIVAALWDTHSITIPTVYACDYFQKHQQAKR